MPLPASSAPVHGPAHTTAARAETWPDVVRTVTWRPSSSMAVTVTPARMPGTAAASAWSAASALITQDSGSSRAGPPIAIPGNLAAASASGSSSCGAPASRMASRTASSCAPKVRCGVGCSSRRPHSSSSSAHGPRARMAMLTHPASS